MAIVTLVVASAFGATETALRSLPEPVKATLTVVGANAAVGSGLGPEREGRVSATETGGEGEEKSRAMGASSPAEDGATGTFSKASISPVPAASSSANRLANAGSSWIRLTRLRSRPSSRKMSRKSLTRETKSRRETRESCSPPAGRWSARSCSRMRRKWSRRFSASLSCAPGSGLARSS